MSDELLNFQSGMDQFGAMSKTLAAVVAQYHGGLVESGISHGNLLDALVRDFAMMYWRKILFGTPPTTSNDT